ncbi:MAG TPA: MerR family transcriptional regulator [Acidimicrobiales bacterium]|nr:MerR family transcriptional regulator [Acidimicrobiales bacterium]
MISITEVAERTGLRPSALRYYEEVGLITSPARQGGRRLYPESVLERLRLIASVQSCGFTIAEIRELLVEDGCTPERWKPLAQRKLAEVGALIEKAKLTRRLLEDSLDCECRALDDCVLTTGRPETGQLARAGQEHSV